MNDEQYMYNLKLFLIDTFHGEYVFLIDIANKILVYDPTHQIMIIEIEDRNHLITKLKITDVSLPFDTHKTITCTIAGNITIS